MPKVGPIDLIAFLRLRGGSKDNAGELRSMDFENRSRKMDFAGQEHRFGPLVNNESGANVGDICDLLVAHQQGRCLHPLLLKAESPEPPIPTAATSTRTCVRAVQTYGPPWRHAVYV